MQRPEELIPVAFLRPRSRIVVTLHGPQWLTVERTYGKVVGAAYRVLVAIGLFRADAVVFVSAALDEELESQYSWLRGKTIILPPMFDSDVLSELPKEVARTRLQIDRDSVVVLFCGRLNKEKNPLFLLEAVSELRKSVPSAFLLICGSGPEELAVRSRSRILGVPIRIISAVSPTEIPWLYACADILAITSDYEGLPTVVLEALASRRPVVSRPLSGLDSLKTPRGAVQMIDDDRPSEFARVAARMLESSIHGRLSFPELEAYSYKAVAARMLDVYYDLQKRTDRGAGF